MSGLTSSNGEDSTAIFGVMEEGVEEEPCVVSATSVGWKGISSSGVKYSDGESEGKVVCRLFEKLSGVRHRNPQFRWFLLLG